ncbi:NAD-P-binding protein [Artomyces pyxidatus]|uniref:NAD-P-binding protein n=1 Tax=Artomyces pyxidatus TaxID=48021 RepID=A0ACB8SVI3_9AGAM|nr:NAD-P-binding protein [Artomyces pyxidatus]
MSGFRTFALAGAGGIGTFIIWELLKAKAAGTVEKVAILTRPVRKETLQKFAAAGAVIVPVDYADAHAVKKALAGVDVVLSTLPIPALDVELAVAKASRAAGVKLFVPSEYGLLAITERVTPEKVVNQEKMKAMGLPYTTFFCGPWADTMFSPYLNLDVASGKVLVGGDGNRPISSTGRRDVARFVVYALTTLPVETLEYQALNLEGDHKSLNEVVNAYEAKTRKKVEVSYRSIEDLKAAVAANPHDFGAQMHLVFALGEGAVGTPDNDLYPDWHPAPIIDFLARTDSGDTYRNADSTSAEYIE